MTAFERLQPYIWAHKKRLLWASLAMAGVAALSGVMVHMIKPIIEGTFVAHDPAKLRFVALLIPAVFLGKLVVVYAQSYLMSYIGQRVTQRIREELFRHLHELSMDYFWRGRSGELLSRVTNDLTLVQSGVHFVPLYLIRDSLTVAVVLGMMVHLNWRFTLTALIAVPAVAVVLRVLGRKLRSASSRGQEVMGDIYHRFQESLQGMLVVKAFRYEAAAISKFERENEAYFDQMMRYFRATSLSGPLMEFLGSLIMAAIVFQAARYIDAAAITPSDLGVFVGAFAMAYMPVKNLSQMNSTLQAALAAADRIFAILDEKPTVLDRPNAATFKGLQDAIVFENVSFRYPGRENWALRGVSLRVGKGEVVALAGPSGSGKTTFVHLLLRLFDPQEGRILIDGRDLREYTMDSVRRHVGLVTQDTILFHDTAAGNVAVGRPEASRGEIERALEVADAADFVRAMPQGLDTPLGDRGMRLSGGQRQRLAIARAVLKNPSILMLDEATSNLDAGSETAVQAALERLFPGRTVLVIAHRLSTIKDADRIAVLHMGELRESGTHGELMGAGSVYATLYKFQQLEPLNSGATLES